ncbi:MAG: fluoride efflux transporter CrcB [Chloroflexota bacterium]
MINIILVGLGGAIGSIARYLTGSWVQTFSKSSVFPLGTLAVNIIGCLIIGVLSQISESRDVINNQYRVFLFFGFLGGFTTFSSFGNDTVNLARSGEFMFASANIIGNVIVGLLAVGFGRTITALILK